jgi:hypothetical protein
MLILSYVILNPKSKNNIPNFQVSVKYRLVTLTNNNVRVKHCFSKTRRSTGIPPWSPSSSRSPSSAARPRLRRGKIEADKGVRNSKAKNVVSKLDSKGRWKYICVQYIFRKIIYIQMAIGNPYSVIPKL